MSKLTNAKLHPEDQEQCHVVIDAFELTEGFEVITLLSDDREAIALAREMLVAKTANFEYIEPADQVGEQLRPLIKKYAHLRNAQIDPKQRPVLWFERPDYDPRTWSNVLSWLNVNREKLRQDLPFLWVIAGPHELHQPFHVSGADFYSIVTQIRFNHHVIKPKPHAHFNFLHLADFQFDKAVPLEQRRDLDALRQRLKALGVDPTTKPRAVIVTGSIAKHGASEEYSQARDYFRSVSDLLQLQPQQDWFLTPGPGDLHAAGSSLPVNMLRNGLTDQSSIATYVRDAQTMQLLNAGLKHFGDFTRLFLGAARAFSPEIPWRTDVLNVDGYRVAFLQLNTVWAGHQPYQALLGEAQLRDCLEQAYDAPMRVALMYHGRDQLRAFDREVIEKLFLDKDGVQLIFQSQGPPAEPLQEGDGQTRTISISSGGVGMDRQPRSFRLLSLDTTRALRGTLFTYAGETWRGDAEQASADSFRIEWQPQPKDALPSTHEEAFIAKQEARYRKAAAAYHGQARLIGMAEDAPKPNTRIANLFVPLKLHPYQSKDQDKSMGTLQLAKDLLYKMAGARIVVLGSPGGGKSSLCRYLTVLFAGEVQEEGFDAQVAPLPMLIPFREYVADTAQQPNLSLLTYLEQQAEAQLNLELPADFIKGRLQAGRVLLFLDGMDEVGTPEERVRMRDRLQAFARAYPKTSMLITSRPVGYNDAPLDQRLNEGFQHWELRDFDDDELKQFINRWYQIMEAQDGLLARDRALDLTKRLGEVEAARELARNPMLATILALVHYYHDVLPSQRVKLYQECIKTMLLTWPSSRGKRFTTVRYEDQLKALGKVALEMQQSRVANEQGEEVKRDPRVSDHGGLQLWRKDYLRERLSVAIKRHCQGHAEDVAQEWLHFLIHDSGLLVELKVGYVGFYHRSLMEYMAAQGLINQEQDPVSLGKEIARLAAQAGWYEVALLAVGIKADAETVIEAMFQALKAKDDWEGWHFLLACLAEEACLDEHLETIAYRLGRLWMETNENNLRRLFQLRNRVLNYSQRHGSNLLQLLERKLRNKNENQLPWIVFAWGGELTSAIIERHNHEAALQARLQFFPHQIGKKAASDLNPRQAKTFALEHVPHQVNLVHQLGLLTGDISGPYTAAQSIRICADMNAVSDMWQDQVEYINKLYSEGMSENMLDTMKVEISSLKPRSYEIFQAFPSFSNCEQFAFALCFALGFARSFSNRIKYLYDLSRLMNVAFVSDRDFTEYFTEMFIYGLVRDFDLNRRFASELDLNKVKPDTGNFMKPIIAQSNPWIKGEGETNPDKAINAYTMLKPSLAWEAWIGMITTHDMTDQKCIGYIRSRLNNRWLWFAWEMVDHYTKAHLPPPLENEDRNKPPAVSLEPVAWRGHPYQQALYLALAWGQAVTTWRWPFTRQWRACMVAPPKHWLPRAHWHFCYLIYDPEDQAHIAGLRQAISDGRQDPELPGYADTFASFLSYDL